MDFRAHTRERIAELRAHHGPAGIKLTRSGRFSWWRNLFVDYRCRMCREPLPCSQLRWCNDVEAGRLTAQGWQP